MSDAWPSVLADLGQAPLPPGKTVWYVKHMTHHLLPEVDRGALAGMRHAFLIRDPRALLASYARVRDQPTLADLGLEQQAGIFRAFGGPVIDSTDLLKQPGPMLARPVRGAGCAVPPRHAVLARRAAGHRRGVGAVLVRRGPRVDRVRPVPGEARGPAR